MNHDFHVLPHTADIKICVYGKTLQELFSNAVVGMFQSIGPRASGCTIVGDRLICKTLPQAHEVEVKSLDLPALMVDFLSEILYLSDVHNEAYLAATVHEMSPTHIKATVHGVKVSGFEVVEIKAVTYHELSIHQEHGYWKACIVFDI